MSDHGLELHQRVIEHVRYCANNHQSSFIGIYSAPETVGLIHNGIIDLVAEREGWLQPITYSYEMFKVASQTLYFRHSILIEVMWRPICPEKIFLELDVTKYTKLFFEWKSTTTDVVDGY